MRSLFLTLCVISAIVTEAQDPYSWKFKAKKIGDKTYEVHFTAKVDQPWHIYSQETPEGGPVPTKFTLKKNPLLIVTGKVKEVGEPHRRREEVFGIDVVYYEDSVDFVQTVTLKANVKVSLGGNIEFMICNDHECMPPATIPFSIPLQP